MGIKNEKRFYSMFRKKRFLVRIRRFGDFGECTPPFEKNREISLNPYSDNKLVTVIHEALHACLWDLSETSVEEMAIDIAKFIKKCFKKGYLKMEDLNDQNKN